MSSLMVVLWMMATIGLTNILVHGKILDLIKVYNLSVREWLKFLTHPDLWDCYECTGFWSGLVCALVFFWGTWWFILPAAFIGSMVSQLYVDVVYLLRGKIELEINDESE